MERLSSTRIVDRADCLVRTAIGSRKQARQLAYRSAHPDLPLALMARVAYSTGNMFNTMVRQRPAKIVLREVPNGVGRQSEQPLMQANNDVNAHHDAKWPLKMLVSTARCTPINKAARSSDRPQPFSQNYPIADWRKSPAKAFMLHTAGEFPVAMKKANWGFPHAVTQALPQLEQSRQSRANQSHGRIDALMSIVTSLSITRTRLWTVETMQKDVNAALMAGVMRRHNRLERAGTFYGRMLELNAPVAAADLLATALVTDPICQPASDNFMRILCKQFNYLSQLSAFCAAKPARVWWVPAIWRHYTPPTRDKRYP